MCLCLQLVIDSLVSPFLFNARGTVMAPNEGITGTLVTGTCDENLRRCNVNLALSIYSAVSVGMASRNTLL